MPSRKSRKNGNPTRSRARGTPPQRRTQRPTARPANRARRGGVPSNLVHAVCSQSDPFCEHANNAKLYDRSSVPSLTIQGRSFATITTNSAGKASFTFSCDPKEGYSTATTYVGSDVTVWAAETAPNEWSDFILNNCDRYRVVSAGFRIISIVAPLSASGSLLVATTIRNADEFVNVNPNTLPNLESVRYSMSSHESTWRGKSRDNTSSEFGTVSGSATTAGYDFACVSIVGAAASTAVLGIDMYWNVECIPAVTSSMSRMASPAAPHVPAIEGATANVLATVPSSISGGLSSVGNTIIRAAKGALTQVLLDGLGSVPVIGGSLRKGASHGMIMDVD